MSTALATRNGSQSEYRTHLRALEHAAAQLERGDLDPEQALEVYRDALRRYEAARVILDAVAEAFVRVEGGADKTNTTQ